MQLVALLAFSILAAKQPTLNEQLLDAVRQNDVALARELLHQGAKADYKSNDRNPLVLEAFRAPTSYGAKGSVEPMVNLLLDRGAKADAIDGFGWCALTLAPRDVSAGLVRKLLDKGADPNRIAMHGDPAIIRFTSYARQDLIALLLDRGAKVDAEGYFGGTAFTEAGSIGRVDIMRYLKSKGANPKFKGWSKQTALHFAVRAVQDNAKVLDYLLSLGLDVNGRSERGMTPLHAAAMFGNVANAKWLLDRGANPHVKDENGKTPLDTAIRYQMETARRFYLSAFNGCRY